MRVNMYLKDLPIGSIVFIDSNIFTYFVLGHRKYFNGVKSFFKHLDMGVYTGYIDQTIVNETYFNFIKVKIAEMQKIKPSDVITFLKENPKELETIDFATVSGIFGIDNLLTLDYRSYGQLGEYISNFGLMPADAIHLLLMMRFGITNLISNDSDFERVDWLKLYKPLET